MRIRFGKGGWVEVDDVPGLASRRLYVRLRPDERGRWGARELYIDGSEDSEPVPGSLLRGLPLELVEGYVNAHPESIARRMTEPGADLSRLASHYATTFGIVRNKHTGDVEPHWVALAQFAQLPDETAKELTGSAVAQAPYGPRPRAARPTQAPPPLTKLPNSRLTDDFLRSVAASYGWAVEQGQNPAPALASDAGVPTKTVHRWVAAARKRGLMPPGHQGRKG